MQRAPHTDFDRTSEPVHVGIDHELAVAVDRV